MHTPGIRRHQWSAVLVLALIVGLLLRLYGIHWGLPDAAHPNYSYHPDEMLSITWANWMVHGFILPKDFQYGGTLYYSMLNAFLHFGGIFGRTLGGINQLADTILFGRYFFTAIALLTILVVFEIGRQLYSEGVGALAALFLALTPSHIVWAQRIRPDEPSAFFAAIIVFLAAKILKANENKAGRYFLYSGIAVGAALAFRAPLSVFIIATFAAWYLRFGRNQPARRWLDKKLLTLLLVIGPTYVVASPYTVLHFSQFLQGVIVQVHYQTTPFPAAVGRGPIFFQYGWSMLTESLGYPFYFLAALGLIAALRKRTDADILLAVAALSYLVLLAFPSWVVVRYTIPAVPLLCLLAARFVVSVVQAAPRYKAATVTVAALAMTWTVMADLAYLRAEALPNVRDVATAWLAAHARPHSSVLTEGGYSGDVYFNPVIPAGLTHYNLLLTADMDPAVSLRNKPPADYVVLNQPFYEDVERLGQRYPIKSYYLFYRYIQNAGYRLVKQFTQPIEFAGISFAECYTSQDYLIANPGIRIYEHH